MTTAAAASRPAVASAPAAGATAGTTSSAAGGQAGAITLSCPTQPAPTVWEKAALAAPGLLLSLVAVGLSAWSLYYTKTKDSDARLRSVRDEYWLRKVVLPTCAEPFLKDLPNLAARMMVGHGAGADRLKADWTELVRSIGNHAANFAALSLLDSTASDEVQRRIEALEDVAARHFGELLRSAATPAAATAPDGQRAAQALQQAGLAVLSAALEAHVNLTKPAVTRRWWSWSRQ